MQAGIIAASLLVPAALAGAAQPKGHGPSDHHAATPVRGLDRGGNFDRGGGRSFASPRAVAPRAVEPRAVAPRAVEPRSETRYYNGDRARFEGDRGWANGNYRWDGGRWWYWGNRGWLWWNGARWIDYAIDAAVADNYRWYNGNWWYWMPAGYWVYWDGSQWLETSSAGYDNGAYDDGGGYYDNGYSNAYPYRGYYRGYDYGRPGIGIGVGRIGVGVGVR
jgi:hypothetical protein